MRTVPVVGDPGARDDSSTVRLLSAMFLLGLPYAVPVVVVAVVIAERDGLAAAGVLLGASGVLGRVLSVPLERVVWMREFWRRAVASAVLGATSAVVVAYAPWWAAVPVLAVGGAATGLMVNVVLHAAGERIGVGSAGSMAGQTVGMFVIGMAGSAVSATAVASAAVAGTAVLEPLIAGRRVGLEEPDAPSAPVREKPPVLRRVWVFPFLLALASYGPTAVFSSLVVTALGAQWAGPQFLAYSLGAWVVAASPRLRRVSHVHAAWLGAAASAVWVSGLHSGGFVLAGRFAAGVLLFTAQGAVLAKASREGGREGIAGAIAGLGVGSQVAVVWCGAVAEVPVPAMAVASAAASCLVAVCVASGAARGSDQGA